MSKNVPFEFYESAGHEKRWPKHLKQWYTTF